MWLVFCMTVLWYRFLTTGSSPIEPLSPDDKAALIRFVDPHLVWFLLIACVLLFFLAAFIGHKVGTSATENRIRALLDQITFEASAALQNFGSLLVGVAWFSNESSYLFGGLAAWAAWLLFKPKAPTHAA